MFTTPAIYSFTLMNGTVKSGQIHPDETSYHEDGLPAVLGILEGASPNKVTYIPWHSVVHYVKLG